MKPYSPAATKFQTFFRAKMLNENFNSSFTFKAPPATVTGLSS
jgi:hypothetical protein